MNRNNYKIFISTILIILLFSINVQASIEKPITFMQTDSEWGSEPYSIRGDKRQTIATSGCGPTSMAMVLNYYVDNNITPLDTSKFALENNYRTRNEGTSWPYFGAMAEQYGLDFLQTSSSLEALQWMQNKEDPLIICSMGPGLWTSRGHFILLWNVEDGVAYFNDPASKKRERNENSYDYMASQCKQYFCFNKPLVENELCENSFMYTQRPFMFAKYMTPINTFGNSTMAPIYKYCYRNQIISPLSTNEE